MSDFLHGPWPLALYAFFLTLLCGYELIVKRSANLNSAASRLFVLGVALYCASLIAAHFV